MALDSGDFIISEQVLNEFSSIALSKLKISKDAIKEYLKFFREMAIVPFPENAAERGLDIAERYQRLSIRSSPDRDFVRSSN